MSKEYDLVTRNVRRLTNEVMTLSSDLSDAKYELAMWETRLNEIRAEWVAEDQKEVSK